MKIIGLCGGSGSGKGVVSHLFAKYGIPHIDTDKVYRDITSYRSECMEKLSEIFGDIVLSADGSLNRERMREIVFIGDDCEHKRKKLNEITHKYVLSETDRIIDLYRKEGRIAVIADVPLLFESGFDKKCDVTVAVVAGEKVRIERITSRDGISEEQANARINSQIKTSELVKKVDYVIENNGDLKELEEKVEQLYHTILEK